jgi:S-methylmethionine-dependent homocysteine/selenocysteine methylase
MTKYRKNLPQLETDQIFLGEGGMMTEFFFGEETKDIEVGEGNLFFHFIRDDKIMKWSEKYYRKFMDLCLKENNEFGYIMIAFWTYKATKANVQEHLNIEEEEWIKMNKDYVKSLNDIRLEYEKSIPNCPPILIQGLLIAKGGNGDAFSLDTKMNCDEAEEYHDGQIRVLAQETQVDFICIFLVSYSEEAIGVCNAAAKYEVPIVISYTTDINGRLKGGESIKVFLHKWY